jgi:hypothetical protein
MFCKLRLAALASPLRAAHLLLLLASMAAGCTVLHVPKPDPFDAPLASLQGASGVNVINVQDDASTRTIGKAGFGTMNGSLRAWTDAAVALMKAELAKAGAKTQPDAAKTLKVAITDASLGVTGIDFVAAAAKCSVRLRVETGSGVVKEDSYQNHALGPPSACDKAVSQAAQAMLRAEEIAAYLRQ